MSFVVPGTRLKADQPRALDEYEGAPNQQGPILEVVLLKY